MLPKRLAMKFGRVLAEHDALAQHVLAEARHELEHLGRVSRVRDDLQQLQPARRVEEVRPQEVLLERLPPRPRPSPGSGCRRCCWRRSSWLLRTASMRSNRDRLISSFSTIDLDDPVGLRQQVEIVLQVAEGDQAGRLLAEDRRRPALSDRLPAGLDDPVADLPVLEGQARPPPRPVSLAGTMSRTTVGMPTSASRAAMPPPIVPAPITAALRIW